MTPRAFLPQPKISQDDGQLCLGLNYQLKKTGDGQLII